MTFTVVVGDHVGAAADGGDAGAALLNDVIGGQHVQESIDFAGLAGELDDEAALGQIHDLGLIDLADLLDLAALRLGGADLQKKQLPLQNKQCRKGEIIIDNNTEENRNG